jgi:alkylhydroperoxidase/carboxymuconolactone decarboxylase family protein YurZ
VPLDDCKHFQRYLTGNTRARLLAVLTVLVPFIGYPGTRGALAAINDISPPINN